MTFEKMQAETDELLEEFRSQYDRLAADEVKWVVNDIGELGVKIGEQFFWLYKGYSLVYENGTHDDGTPMLWRRVGKREFGEVCHPVDWYEKQFGLAPRYTRECVATSLSFEPNNPEYEWQPLHPQSWVEEK